MITIFNRKILFQDTNSEAVAKVWSTLKKNGIKYEMVTKTHMSSFRRMATQQANINFNAGGIPANWTDNQANYLYIIYVNRKDYEKAKQVCNL